MGKINYAFITMTYIAQAKIGFGLPWGISYAIGGILAVAYVAGVIWYGGKRAAKLGVKEDRKQPLLNRPLQAIDAAE